MSVPLVGCGVEVVPTVAPDEMPATLLKGSSGLAWDSGRSGIEIVSIGCAGLQ